MRFWDSSAVVPLVCRERQSASCRNWLRGDQVMIVWAFAACEVLSALARKRREGALNAHRFAIAKRRLAKLEDSWTQVIQYELVQRRARRLLETHPLRAADALHLAAALVAVEERTAGIEFVTFDQRLAEAAGKEGFTLLAAP
jgi:predicted nucleic acid-binding protein